MCVIWIFVECGVLVKKVRKKQLRETFLHFPLKTKTRPFSLSFFSFLFSPPFLFFLFSFSSPFPFLHFPSHPLFSSLLFLFLSLSFSFSLSCSLSFFFYFSPFHFPVMSCPFLSKNKNKRQLYFNANVGHAAPVYQWKGVGLVGFGGVFLFAYSWFLGIL